jgi:hypothetical protein
MSEMRAPSMNGVVSPAQSEPSEHVRRQREAITTHGRYPQHPKRDLAHPGPILPACPVCGALRYWHNHTTDVWETEEVQYVCPYPCRDLAQPMPDGSWRCGQHALAWHAAAEGDEQQEEEYLCPLAPLMMQRTPLVSEDPSCRRGALLARKERTCPRAPQSC